MSTIKDKKEVYRQRLVTVIGTNYIDQIVPRLLEDSFSVYSKRDFSQRNFQVSIHENANATSGIVLIVLGIEAYRNRIYYLEKKEVSKNVARDLGLIFKEKSTSFPIDKFQTLLTEAWIIRDVIIHNHIYEVEVVSNRNDWKMLSHRQRLLEGYGDWKRFGGSVTERTRKTNQLKLNVQPGKIGFEDLFKMFLIFDFFIAISANLLSREYVPFHFFHKELTNLSNFITNYYHKIPNLKYRNSLELILSKIKNDYGTFLPDFGDYFIVNSCSQCGAFGYKRGEIRKCDICGREIKLSKMKIGNV